MDKSKKLFLIFTAAFLGCVLLVGIILGTIAIVKNARSVMIYKGVYLKEGVANYISASYKYDFMKALGKSGVECYDSEDFWQSEAADGRTYADILVDNTEKYIKSVMVGSYLFDKNTRLTKDDKKIIEKAVNEVLEYRADGDKDRFNEISKAMGFDFKDFKEAAELLYKSQMAETVIFGYEGSSLSSGNFSSECDDYFVNNYSRVRLMIIRTDGEIVIDPDTGKEVLAKYDDAQKSEALEKIADIRAKIADGRMDEEAFLWHIKNEYPTNTVNDTEGYYFSSNSAYSLQFAEDGAPEVVKLALSGEVGKFYECELDIGTCFIYKTKLESGAYSRYAISHFFEDFYKNAAPYIYQKSVDVYLSDVNVKNKYDRTAVISQPYNLELAVKFD